MNESDPDDERSNDRQPATRNELAAAATEKTLKRPRWEYRRLAACPGERRVNVTNYSHSVAAARSGEHTYTVTVAPDGLPSDYTCPAAEYQSGPCKHAVAVADAPDMIGEAMHGGETPDAARGGDAARVAADGGQRDTDGGHERACFGPLKSKSEVSDEQYCAKYIVPASECVFSDGDGGCPHDVLTADGETCDECGLLLAAAHEQPVGYTRKVLGDDGDEYVSEICGACADIRAGHPRGERKTADELGERAEVEA